MINILMQVIKLAVGIILYYVGLVSTSPALILLNQSPSYLILSYLGPLFRYISCTFCLIHLPAGINIIININSLHAYPYYYT